MKPTDPIVQAAAKGFEFFLVFTMVWVVLFFMALPIGAGREEVTGTAAHVKRKALYSALLALALSALYFLLK